MKRIAFFAAAVVLLGCGSRDTPADTTAAAPPAAAPMSDVDKAIAVHHAIGADPTKTDSVLTAHGLTAAGLDSLMYRIAADSAMRAQFAARR